MITSENAHEINSFTTTDIHSMVDYYYASRIRGDEKWKAVLGPEEEWSDRLKYAVNEHNNWRFLEYRNEGFQGGSERYLTVYFKIEYNGRTDSGSNEVTVSKRGETWFIKKMPC